MRSSPLRPGTLFYVLAWPLYEGMVVGENARPGDIRLTFAARTFNQCALIPRDMEIRLTPPTDELDEAVEYLADDELLEVTPDITHPQTHSQNRRTRQANQEGKEALENNL